MIRLFSVIQIKRCRRYSAASFFYVLVVSFFATSTLVLAQSNEVLKKVYKISDPRNPHCPCHKQQKKAEKEFKKIRVNKDVVLGLQSDSINTDLKTHKLQLKTIKKRALRININQKIPKAVFKFFFINVNKKLRNKNKIAACPKW